MMLAMSPTVVAPAVPGPESRSHARGAAFLAAAAMLATAGCPSRDTSPQGACVPVGAASASAAPPTDPRVALDLSAICEGDERSGDKTFDPRTHDALVDRWIRGALATELGKRVYATIRGGDGLVDRGALLAAEATRAGLAQCTLAAALRGAARVASERADVARVCAAPITPVTPVTPRALDAPIAPAASAGDAFPAVETEAGQALVTALRGADHRARGSLLRHASQRLALASCPRAEAWDAAHGLAVESDDPAPRPPVLATTPEFAHQVATGADDVLDAAWPAIVACHRAAIVADAPFDGTIRVVFELGVPRFELRKGVAGRAFSGCLRDALEAPPKATEIRSYTDLSFRTPEGRDTWTAHAVSARVAVAQVHIEDERTPRLKKGQVRMIPMGEPWFPAPLRESAVRDAIAHRAQRLRACYDQARARAPQLGEATLEDEFTVDLSGAVEIAAHKGGSLADADARTCVLGVLRALAFTGAPEKARVAVTLSFTPT
jgi:hypothetical protein